MAEPASAQPSRGRWYVLLLISVMYLITYLDRVNISTAAPKISKEFGFDKVTMGVIFSAFVWAYALFQVPGGWLERSFRRARRAGRHRRLLVDHDGSDRRGLQRDVVHCPLALPVRHRRSRRVSGRNPRHATLVSAARARLGPRRHPQRQPVRRGNCAADRGADHESVRLASGLLHLRCGRHCSGRYGGALPTAICRKSTPW